MRRSLIFVVVLAACATVEPKPTTTIDGVKATLDRQEAGTVVVLDTENAADAAAQEATIWLGVRAAEELTGCQATHRPGTLLAFAPIGFKPVYVPVDLAC